MFRSGHEIGTAVILYGADGLPTPTGKFPILAKLKDHRSITYDNAPMPYTLRLTPRRRFDPRQQRPLGLRHPRLRRRSRAIRSQAVRCGGDRRRSPDRVEEAAVG